jgi:lipopolysaccharide export system permease protein
VGSELERTRRESRSDREMSARMMRKEVATLKRRRAAVVADLDSTVGQAGFPNYAAARAILQPAPAVGPGERLRGILALMGGSANQAPPPAPSDSLGSSLPPAMAAKVSVKEVELKAIDRRIHSYEVEIHKKFSIPVACIAFMLIGAPIGIRARRGGFSVGFLSVAFFLFYYVCLIGGEQLADRAILPPAIAMWLADVVLGVIGIILTWRTVQPDWQGRGREARRLAAAGALGTPRTLVERRTGTG